MGKLDKAGHCRSYLWSCTDSPFYEEDAFPTRGELRDQAAHCGDRVVCEIFPESLSMV